MKHLAIALSLAACALSAHASCTGSDSYRFCTDSSGNPYSSSTYHYGSND